MNKNNSVDIDDNEKTTRAEWFTIREMIGLPGMPTSAQGCHKMMSKIVAEHPELKRKIQGSKAFEFHYTALPADTQAYLFSGESPSIETKKENSLLNQWIEIFNRMTEMEREQIISYVFRHGFGRILALTATQEIDKIFELLNSLSAAERQEILQSYDEAKHSGSAFKIDPLIGKKVS